MSDVDEPLVATADVVVREVTAPASLSQALVLLDTQELMLGVPLVDEAERERLDAARAHGDLDASALGGWRPVIALRDDDPVGYAAVVLPADASGVAVGDLAPARLPGAWMGIVPALLDGLEAVATSAAGSLQIWVRHVDIGDLAPAVAAGYRVERRLGVLGRHLAIRITPRTPPDGITIRPYRGESDDAGVVEVLAGAYEGTGDGGWDLARFERRRGLPWFRSEDLLIAVDGGGRTLGIHWMKRRDAITGEVYNLAIHPDGQGKGLGPALLEAGLAHLREVGCAEVILWVDRANERATSLYTSRGFETKWDDVALRHDLAPAQPS